MPAASHYEPNQIATCRLFNIYDSIRNQEVPLIPAFQNFVEVFLGEHRITQTKGKTITKLAFTADLLTDNIFFFMDFNNMGVEFYDAAKKYFDECDFEGSFSPDVQPDVVSIILPVGPIETRVYYRMGYICLTNENVRPLVAFEFKD